MGLGRLRKYGDRARFPRGVRAHKHGHTPRTLKSNPAAWSSQGAQHRRRLKRALSQTQGIEVL